MKKWLMKITAVVGLVLILPVIAPAFTTTPVSVIPTVAQTDSIYDTGAVQVDFDSTLTGSAVTQASVVSSYQVAKLGGAESTPAVLGAQVSIGGVKATEIARRLMAIGVTSHYVRYALDDDGWT